MVKAKIDYSKSKVYKIYCPTEPSLCYIGSTTKQYLSQRMDGHRSKYKTCKKSTTSYLIFDKYGIENCIIELLELYPCNSIDELRTREGFYIQNNNCINRCVAGRTKSESQKEYIKRNKDKIKVQANEYRIKNKDKIKEYRKQNKDKIKVQDKEYQIKNKDKISMKNKYRYIKNKIEQHKLNMLFLAENIKC